MDLLNQTTVQLQERLEQIIAAENVVYTSFRGGSTSRPNLGAEKVTIMLELARRGIRTPGSPNPDQMLLDALSSVQDMVDRRVGFAFHQKLLPLLQELLEFRRALRRPELTVQDVANARNEMGELGALEPSAPWDILEWGLRRGFEMRAEERAP